MVVANRYAKALFEQAVEQKQVELVQSDLALVLETIEQVDDFRLMIASPIVSAQDKKQVCSKVFSSISDLTAKFIHLVIDNGREVVLAQIVKAFETLYLRSEKKEKVKITTAKNMSQSQTQQIKDRLKKQFDLNDVTIDAHVEPSIIGGVIIQMGDKEYDGSILNKLKRIKQQAIAQ